MKVFAIRHAPTGTWMPARMSRSSGSGWSFWEPTLPGVEHEPFDKNPRIFFTLQSARNALTAWLQGTHHRDAGETNSYFDREPYDDHRVEAPPVPRARADMRIVPLTLTEEVCDA